MQSLGRRRPAWRRLGWALALLAGVLAAPTAARASCGDYVRIGDPTEKPTAMPPHAAPESGNPPGHGGPCHGPGCNRHPVAPPAPTAPISSPAEEWGWVSRTVDCPPRTPETALRDEAASPPVRRPSPVYHPPRV
jgi:hypothetical protein